MSETTESRRPGPRQSQRGKRGRDPVQTPGEKLGQTSKQSPIYGGQRSQKKSEGELIDMTGDVQYNRGCLQKMAQILMDLQDLEIASKAHGIMLEVMEAAPNSASSVSCNGELTACKVAQSWAS